MSIHEIRRKIDALDEEIQKLLLKRLALVKTLHPYKNSITDKKREEEILSKISSPLVQEIYRAIFRSSKKLLIEP